MNFVTMNAKLPEVGLADRLRTLLYIRQRPFSTSKIWLAAASSFFFAPGQTA